MAESAMTLATATPSDADLLATPFVRELAKVVRAQDSNGVWDGKTDLKLLEPFILTPERRRTLPIIGDPDPEILWYVELFYNTVGLCIERRTAVMVTPMMKMHHEGFGRLVLIAGRLVVCNRQLRDMHRFGYPSLASLSEAGEKLVEEGVAMIKRYPQAAHYGA